MYRSSLYQRMMFAFLLFFAAACGKDDNGEEASCTSDLDCPDGLCVHGACEPQTCLNNCPEPDDELDMSLEDTGNGEPDVRPEPDMGAPRPDVGDDMEYDNVPPQVVDVTPADDATDVAVDTTVTVTFDEAMRATTLNVQSVELRDASNTRVPASIAYDEATFTATLTPDAPLTGGNPYRVVVTTFVRDEAGNALTEEYTWRFYTLFEQPPEIAELAAKWAPVIFQGLSAESGPVANLDIPTSVDFDGNLRARDNRSNSARGSARVEATVYYTVTQSETHTFITYVLYYAGRVTSLGDEHEHDFTGATFVIDRATDSLVLVEGVRVQQGSDAVIAFKPSDSAVTGSGRLDTYPVDANVDGRYPMYVPAGVHEACNFPVEGDPPFCLHNAGEMPEGTSMGVVLRPGDAGQRLNDAVENPDTGFRELTYQLVPIGATLWMWRTNVGNDELWEQTATYAPLGEDRPATDTTGSPIVLPTRLVSDDETSYGKSPFQWLRSPSETNYGQWLIDPTVMLTARYEFGESWSTDYCYNPFLGLDRRGDANFPACESAP